MIRRACDADRGTLIGLYDACFPGEQGFRDWIFQRVWRAYDTLLYERDGRVLSSLMDIPVRLSLGDERFDAHYIYAAGTLPEARGQKLMSALLERAFEEGTARGQQFSALITGNDSLFDFYRPFGYRTLSAVSRFYARPNALPDGFTMHRAASADIEAMLSIYRAETAEALAIFRDEEYFELMLELYGDGLLVLLDEKDTVKAYAFTEKNMSEPLVSEIFGPEKHMLASAICNQMGGKTVFQSIAYENHKPNGCVKPLTARAEAVLAELKCPPYINIMFN